MTYQILVVDDSDQATRVVKIEGRVTRDSSTDLQNELTDLIKGSENLKLDLSQVSYVDSAGIAVFIQVYKRARSAGVEYRLLNPSAPVRTVLDLARLDQLFTIELSPEPDQT